MKRIEHIMSNVYRRTEHVSIMESVAIRAAVLGMSEALKANPNLIDLEGRIGTATIEEIHRLAAESKD